MMLLWKKDVRRAEKENKFCYECPDNFVPGRIKKNGCPSNWQPFLFISYALALYTNVGVSTLASALPAAL